MICDVIVEKVDSTPLTYSEEKVERLEQSRFSAAEVYIRVLIEIVS